jgi:hypothetical protein
VIGIVEQKKKIAATETIATAKKNPNTGDGYVPFQLFGFCHKLLLKIYMENDFLIILIIKKLLENNISSCFSFFFFWLVFLYIFVVVLNLVVTFWMEHEKE